MRTDDTDCLIIALGSKNFCQSRLKIWLGIGLQNKNNQNFIYINGLHNKLGEQLCKALLAYHALTGSDYTTSLGGKEG